MDDRIKEKTYAVKWISNVRNDSTSGAVFPAIAKYIIDKKNGYVCGCVLDNMVAKHIVSNKWSDVINMQGSKYVQSKMGTCFNKIEELLKNNKSVLFSGTSCQVAGLNNFLKNKNINQSNLLTLDFFCHGVPAPKIWSDYLNLYKKKYNRRVVGYRFRTKKYGWKNARHLYTLMYESGDKVKEDSYSFMASRLWNEIFFSNICLRPSCYQCKYATVMKPSDFTVGDFWGIEDVLPKFDDNRGCSLLIARTLKGQNILQSADYLTLEQTTMEETIRKQYNATRTTQPNRRIEEFMMDYQKYDLQYLSKKYFNYRLTRRIKCFVHRILFQMRMRKTP